MSVIGKPLLTGIKLGSSSGPIAYWTRGVAAPLRSLVANIDPVQDLHGYNVPWAAGCGTNLFDCPTTASTSNTGTLTPNGDGSITIEATAGNVASLWYVTLPRTIPAGTNVTISLNNSDTNSDVLVRLVKLAPGESGTQSYGTACYADSVNKVLTVNQIWDAHAINIAVKTVHSAVSPIVLKVQVEVGDSATAWTPYSNVCPVTGWTGAKVTRTGKNLLKNIGASTVTHHDITYTKNADGTVTANGTNSEVPNGQSYYTFSINLPAGNYYFNAGIENGTLGHLDAFIWDSTTNTRAKKWNGTTNVDSAVRNQLYEVQILDGHSYLFDLRVYGRTVTDFIFYPMICASTETDPSFEPYTDATYPISWQSSAGTVYGGTLDVLTGKLTVKYASEILNSVYYFNKYSNYYLWFLRSPDANPRYKLLGNALSDIFAPRQYLPGHLWTGSESAYIGVVGPDQSLTTQEEANSWMADHPAQVVFELATPIEYTISPTQISSIVGENNLWSDTGDLIAEYIQRSLQFVS